MYVDLQINLSALERTLIDLVNRSLWARGVCVEGVMDLPFDIRNPEPGVIARLEATGADLRTSSPDGNLPFRSRPVRTRISLPPTSYEVWRAHYFEAQPVIATIRMALHAARLADLESAGVDALPEDRERVFLAHPAMRLDVAVLNSAARLSLELEELYFEFLGVFIGADDPGIGLEPGVVQPLRDEVSRLELPSLNISSLLNMLGPAYKLWNAGLSINDGALTLRLQLEQTPEALRESATDETIIRMQEEWRREWRVFIMEGVPNRLNGSNWAIHVPSELFIRSIDAQVEDGLSGRDDIKISGRRIRSRWAIANGHPSVRTTIDLTLVDACKPWGSDIDVAVTINTILSMPRTGILRADVRIDHDTDDLDLALCGLGNAFLSAWAGVAIGGVFGGIPGAIIGGIVGGVAGFSTTIAIGSSLGIPASTEFGRLERVPGRENEFFQEFPIDVDAGDDRGGFRVQNLDTLPDGMMLIGDLRSSELSGPILSIIGNPEFDWGVMEACSSDERDYGAVAVILMRNTGVASLSFCSANLPAPVAIIFSRSDSRLKIPSRSARLPSRGGYLEIRALLSRAIVHELQSMPAAERPSFRLLIQSTGGARLITPAIELSQLTNERFDAAMEFQRNTCAFQEIRFEPSMFRFPVIPFRQFPAFGPIAWWVRAKGLQAGRSLRLTDEAAKLTKTFEADRDGLIAGFWWQGSMDAADTILVEIDAGVSEPVQAGAGELSIIRGRYQTTGLVRLRSKYRSHHLGVIEDRPMLWIIGEGGAHLHDLDLPEAPRLLAFLKTRGLEAGCLFRGTPMAWGSAGLWTRRGGEFACIINDHVNDLAIIGSLLAAVTENRLVLFDRLLKQSQEIEQSGGRALSWDGSVLRLVSDETMLAFRLGSGNLLVRIDTPDSPSFSVLRERIIVEDREPQMQGRLAATLNSAADAAEIHVLAEVVMA